MKKETIKKTISVLFILYLVVLFFILFLYGARNGNQFRLEVFSKEHFERVNYIPFATLASFIQRVNEQSINFDIVVRNMAANLLMFVPMGMALPVMFEKRFDRLWKVTLFVAVLVLVVEIIQFITFSGSADIDDLILNTVGAAAGYGIIRLSFVRRWFKLDSDSNDIHKQRRHR